MQESYLSSNEMNVKSITKEPIKDLIVITTAKQYLEGNKQLDANKEEVKSAITDINIQPIIEASVVYNNSKKELERAIKYHNSCRLNSETTRIELENSEFKICKAIELNKKAKNELKNATCELSKAQFELIQAESKTNKVQEQFKILMAEYEARTEKIENNLKTIIKEYEKVKNNNELKSNKVFYKVIFGIGVISSIMLAYFFGRASVNSNGITNNDENKTENILSSRQETKKILLNIDNIKLFEHIKKLDKIR